MVSNDDLVDSDYTVPNTESPVETLARVSPTKENLDNLTLWEQQQVEKGLSPSSTPVNVPANVPANNIPNAPISSNIVPQTGTNNPLIGSQLQQLTQQGTGTNNVSKYINQDYVAPDYTNEDFLPGKGTPIKVGNYTGKTIGSVDLFAPTGQYIPYNIIAKREAALAKARQARAARQSTYKDPTVIDVVSPKYNEKFKRGFTEQTNAVMKKAKAQYGDYAIDALQDPTSDVYREMQQTQANYNYLGAKSNELINNASSILAEVEKGNTTNYSEKTIEASRNLLNTDQYDYDVNKMVDNGKKLEGYYSVDKYLNEDKYFSALKEQIDSEIKDNGGSISEITKKTYTEQADLMAKQLKKTKYSGSPEVTEQDIKDAIFARVPQMGQSLEDIKMKPIPTFTAKQEIKKESTVQRAKDVDAVTYNYVDKNGNTTKATKNVFGRIKGKSTEFGVIQNADIQKAGSFNYMKKLQGSIATTIDNNIKEAEGFEDFTKSSDILLKNAEEASGLKLTKAKLSYNKDEPGVVRVYSAYDKDKYKEVSINDAEAIQDALIELNYGKEAVQYKNQDVVKVDLLDAENRPVTKYYKTKDAGTAAAINGFLNESTSDDQKIPDPDVQTEAKANSLLGYGSSGQSTPAKKATKTPEQEKANKQRTEKINTIINQNPDAYAAWLKHHKGDKAKARQSMLDNAK